MHNWYLQDKAISGLASTLTDEEQASREFLWNGVGALGTILDHSGEHGKHEET